MTGGGAPIPILLAGAEDRAALWLEAARALPEIALIPYRPDLALEDFRYCLIWRPVPGLFTRLPNLALILTLGAGCERLLADPDLPPRIPIQRMVEPGLTQAVAHYVLWQVLYHHRRIGEIEALQAENRWQPLDYPHPGERRIAVLGLGALGAAAAKLLADFGFSVAGWSRGPKTLPDIACFAGETGLADCLAGRDIVVGLLPLTPATRHLFDKDFFAKMKKGAILINLGRGDHLVEGDFLLAIAEGEIGGASLDVFAEEPLPAHHPFWSHPRIRVTPHNAGFTEPATALPEILRAIRRAETGAAPDRAIDRRAGY